MSEGRVLVVDDEADVRKSVRMILSKVGYDVVEAEDGEAVVRAIKRRDNPFALGAIISDLNMPKMSGMEAIPLFSISVSPCFCHCVERRSDDREGQGSPQSRRD